MSVIGVTPYLILLGRAPDAIALYREALGATVAELHRFGDVHEGCPDAMKERVMHAELHLGDARLMLSDGPSGDEPLGGGPVCVAIRFSDPGDARRSFDALAAEGEVNKALFDAPWGDLFGVVEDAFGVRWMCSSPSKPS